MGTCRTQRNMLLPSCYHAKFGRSRSHRLGEGRVPKFGGSWAPPLRCGACRTPKIGGGEAGALPLGTRACRTPRNMLLPHMCHHAIFGLSRSKSIGVGEVSNLRRGVSDLLETRPSLQVLPSQVWSNKVKQVVHNYGDPTENFDPSRPAFQGHTRSLELTRIDRQPDVLWQLRAYLRSFPR